MLRWEALSRMRVFIGDLQGMECQALWDMSGGLSHELTSKSQCMRSTSGCACAELPCDSLGRGARGSAGAQQHTTLHH